MDRYILLALLYALLLFPGQYFYKAALVPEGAVLAVDNDATYLGTAKSFLWELKTPWPDPDVSAFTDVTLGSAISILPVGVLWLLTGADPWHAMIALNFMLTFAYLVAILHVMKLLLNEGEWKTAFPLLLFANGIGGVLYFPFDAFTSFSEAGLNNLFWGWMTSPAIYQTFTLLAGYASFYFFLKGEKAKSTTALALAFLVYPTAGLLFSGMIFTYSAVKRSWKEPMVVIIPAALLLLPWAYFISLNTAPYWKLAELYSAPILHADRFIFTFAVNSGLALLFAGYAFLNKGIRNANKKFLFAWSGLLALAVLGQTVITKMDVAKFLVMYWVPLSMLAAIGIRAFSEKYKISEKHIFAAVMLLSLPSFFLFYTHTGLNNAGAMDMETRDALLALREYPQGNVLAAPEIGRYVPYYAEKRSVTGGPLPSNPQIYGEFYSGRHEEIISRYNVTYVFATNETIPVAGEELFSNSAATIYKIA